MRTIPKPLGHFDSDFKGIMPKGMIVRSLPTKIAKIVPLQANAHGPLCVVCRLS